jgi:hypothetical protein
MLQHVRLDFFIRCLGFCLRHIQLRHVQIQCRYVVQT